jgi:hypothetical protein
MGTLAPVAPRACAGTGPCGPRPCAGPGLLHSRLSRQSGRPGLRPCGPRAGQCFRVVTVRWSSFISLASRHGPGRPGSLICHFLCPSRSESHRQRHQVEGGVRRSDEGRLHGSTDNLKSRQSDTGESDHHRDPIPRLSTLAPVARRVPAQAQLASLEVVMPGWPAAPVNASESLRSTGHLNFSIRVSPRP